MTQLESLALLIADLNAQLRAAQQENAALREQITQGKPSPAPMPTWDADGPTTP